MAADGHFGPGRQILPVAAVAPVAKIGRFNDLPLAWGLRGGARTGVFPMAATSTSPYANPLALQTAVLQPPATQAPQQTAAARRSFKSFVEAMDDFGGDRRDVAGMRQVLSMQQENQRVAAAQPPQQPPVARSFAPDQAEPEVPIVLRGWTPSPAAAPGALPRPDPANVVPGLPQAPSQAKPQAFPAGVQSSALPQLPAADGGQAPALVIDADKIKPAAGALNAGHPAAQRIVAYAPVAPAPQAAGAEQAVAAPLRSPMIDQVRDATRAGTRPGVTDETMARFAAAADRRRGAAAPMPPRLQAQEARWNRDAWQATVTSARQAPPRAQVSEPAMASASALPRLPTAPTVE